jgi:hypothetical protein
MFGPIINADSASPEPFWLWPWFGESNEIDALPVEFTAGCWQTEHDFLLRQWIYENPLFMELEPEDGQRLQMLANDLHRGHLPALPELAEAFPENAESPINRHRLIRYIYFLNQVGPLGRLRGEQLTLMLRIQNHELLLKTLSIRHQESQKDSPDHQQLHLRLTVLRDALNEMIVQFERLLEQDPSSGSAISIKKLNARKNRHSWFLRILSSIGRLAKSILR